MNCLKGDGILRCDLLEGLTVSAVAKYLPHILFAQLAVAVSLTSCGETGAHSMFSVLLNCDPLKVLGTIVALIAVLVIHDQFGALGRTKKGFGNQPMHPVVAGPSVNADMNLEISPIPSVTGFQDSSHEGSARSCGRAISANVTQTGGTIKMLQTLYRLPLFSHGINYTTISNRRAQ